MEKYNNSQNCEQSTGSDQTSHEQLILQLIHHNDITTLKELGIKTKNMNFLESYAEIQLDYKISPLICASYLGKVEIVKLLLDNPLIDIDMASEDCGHTPLTAACSTGNFEVLQLLLEANAEVNKPTSYYQTPFICCFQRLEVEQNVFENRKICLKMAELCLMYGADIDWIVDRIKGYTLLMQLVSIKMDLSDTEIQINYEIIRFLIENGANKNLETMKKKTLFQLANKHPNKENIQNLITNSKQIYFYNKKSDFIQLNAQNNQSSQIQKNNEKQKGKSVMKYLAFCKN